LPLNKLLTLQQLRKIKMTAPTNTGIKLVSLESACLIRTEKCETDDMREFVFKLSGSVDENWKCHLKQYCNELISDIEKNQHGANHSWLLTQKPLAEEWKSNGCKEIKNFLEIANFCENKLIIKSTRKDLIRVFALINIIQYADLYFRERGKEEKFKEETLIMEINQTIKGLTNSN